VLQIARVSHVLNVSRHIGKALNLAIDKTVPSCSHALVMHFEPSSASNHVSELLLGWHDLGVRQPPNMTLTGRLALCTLQRQCEPLEVKLNKCPAFDIRPVVITPNI
jgi:hypothetical protein